MLKDLIEQFEKKTQEFLTENSPFATGVWWNVMDADYHEMKALQDQHPDWTTSIDHSGRRVVMQCTSIDRCTIFVYSKPVKVTTQVIVEETNEPVL